MIASISATGDGWGSGGGSASAGGARAPSPALLAMRERQQRQRTARINELVTEAERSQQSTDRAYWSLVYDLELAPMTSNRRQLEELGVLLPSPDSLSDEALRRQLWVVIDALADLYTYLVHTDHLSDRELYSRLANGILDEQVHEICESSGGREFIDLAGGAALEADSEPSELGAALVTQGLVDRDRLLPRPE